MRVRCGFCSDFDFIFRLFIGHYCRYQMANASKWDFHCFISSTKYQNYNCAQNTHTHRCERICAISGLFLFFSGGKGRWFNVSVHKGSERLKTKKKYIHICKLSAIIIEIGLFYVSCAFFLQHYRIEMSIFYSFKSNSLKAYFPISMWYFDTKNMLSKRSRM